jgi:oxygen-independent coproporphyrinogen-3 oxidase
MGRFFGNLEALGKPKPKQTLDIQLDPTQKKSGGLLLYIHVPFCQGKCPYCAFHSQSFNQVTFNWYMKTLAREIDLWSERLNRPTVQTVYFGGGTPNLLQPPEVDKIMGRLHKAFRLEPGLEVSMEANPDAASSASYFRSIMASGVNRVSLGVQSLEDDQLKLLGRSHSAKQAMAAVANARSAGLPNLALDLIWGLPGQRPRAWMDMLKGVAKSLRPEHISCYNLTIEPGTPLEKSHSQGALHLPRDSEQARMFVHGAEYLESEGYIQYEISNFARMGYSCRHNAGYWEGQSYLGLGPSAVSTIGDRRFTNPTYMDAYDAAVRGGFAGMEFETLDDATRLREYVMLSLRTAKGVSLAEYRKRTGRDLVSSKQSLMDTLYKNGLIRISHGHLRLTKNGMLVSNAIVERLLEE